MRTSAARSRIHVLSAVLVFVLALALGGTALAQRSSGSNQANVTILDGKIKLSPSSFAPGRLTLVAVNKGTASHALEIMGTGLQPKRTPAIGRGKSAQLTVTLKVGVYHLWDPIKSSMSHAATLTVKAPAASTSGSSSSGSSTSGSSSSSTGSGSSTGTGTGGGTGTTGAAPVCDHMEVGTDCG